MKRKVILFILLSSLLLLSCGKKADTKGIQLKFSISPETVTDALYIKMNYDFFAGPEFKKLAKDYHLYVHFWRPNNKSMLMVDDHQPQKATSTWQPGEHLQYSRILYIPKFLNEFDMDFQGSEEINLTIGMYDPTPGSTEKGFVLFDQKIKVQPASATAPEIVYDEGWYDLETDAKAEDPFFKNWRWTNKKAVCIIENVKKESTLIVKGGVDKSVYPDQKIIVKVNDNVVDEFVPTDGKFSKEYTVTPEMTGANTDFQLTFETDKTFIPAKIKPNAKDERELGMQIYFVYFREKLK